MKSKTKKDTRQSKLDKLYLEYAQVRLDITTNKVKNTNAHKPIKKQIARILTEITQKK